MRYTIRDLETESKFAAQLTVEAIGKAVPTETIRGILVDLGLMAQRERKLNAVVTVLVVIMMSIHANMSIGAVMDKVVRGLRFVWPDPEWGVPGDSAISYRRYQLGVRPLAALFRQVCRPIATTQTLGAFLFGLRTVAIDCTTENVADTAENARVFGRPSNQYGTCALPQVLCAYLIECGTHATLDAGFWPCHANPHKAAARMLRSVVEGMLCMWDCGLHSYDLVSGVRKRKAHVLSRLSLQVRPQVRKRLRDGSYLAYISSYKTRRKDAPKLQVRIIEYRINDPGRPGHNQLHRLLTTLLDPIEYPILDLICAYHERWEIELAIDEMDTHQRLPNRPLRSLRPLGVIQELYGLLIGHYALRHLMHDAALQAGVDPDRLSFVHGLRKLLDAIPEFQMVAPEHLPQLYRRLLRDIAQVILPPRRNRINPRVVRRRQVKFNTKRPQHYHWPQPTRTFREAIALI
jgi:hypothetical protein